MRKALATFLATSLCKGEEVFLRGIIRFGPKVESVGHIDEARHHPHLVRAAIHAPFEHVSDLELPSHLADIHIFVLEGKSGGAGDNEQAVNVSRGN